jgi:hypothetical protein
MQLSRTSAGKGRWSAIAPSITVLPNRRSPSSLAIADASKAKTRVPAARIVANRIVGIIVETEFDDRWYETAGIH